MNNVRALESLCEAGRYTHGCENRAKKDEAAFEKTLKVFKEAETIIFNSMISNEEAMILQGLKEKYGYKLINKEAKKFQGFLNDFSSLGGKRLYKASLDSVAESDAVIVLGCSVSTDSAALAGSLKSAKQDKDAYIAYMHPLEDESLKTLSSQHIKYEVGSEEGLVAMLADLLIDEEGKEKFQSFFNDLDEGYICGESSVGEEEFDEMNQELQNREKTVLVIGADLFNHPRSKNIARMLGMISRYSKMEILMIPSELNTLGVVLICDLDETAEGKTVGYNLKADYTLSFLKGADLAMPGLTQQEGTFTSFEKRVIPMHESAGYEGYRLVDIANALGNENERTTDYTAKLPAMSGYKAVAFADLKSGYALKNVDAKSEDEGLEEVDEISEFNGTVVYRCNHPLSQSEEGLILLGSKQFATAAKIKAGTMVRFEMDGKTYDRSFKVSEDLKGTIAYNPVFDSTDNYDEYRYKRVNLEEVNG